MPRTDYVHDPHAPTPNTLVPAVCAAVFDDDRRILLQKRRDNGKWALPGGRVEISESVADAAIREVREETGIDVRVMHLIGVYSDPGYVIAYADGEVRRQFALLVACSVSGGQLQESEESTDIGFFAESDVAELDLSPGQDQRIADGFAPPGPGAVR